MDLNPTIKLGTRMPKLRIIRLVKRQIFQLQIAFFNWNSCTPGDYAKHIEYMQFSSTSHNTRPDQTTIPGILKAPFLLHFQLEKQQILK